MTTQIQTPQFITPNARLRSVPRRAKYKTRRAILKFKAIDLRMMTQDQKLKCFIEGTYTKEQLTDWLTGKPSAPGWYDTMTSGQAGVDRMYNKENGHDSDPIKATIQDPIPGRRYWNGLHWSEPLVYFQFLSEEPNNFETAETIPKPQRAVYKSWKAPAIGAILNHKYIVYRGLKNPPVQ